MKIPADTDMCMSLEIRAHVHQMMFTNALSCIFLYCNVVITAQRTVNCCCSTANILNWSFTIKFLVKLLQNRHAVLYRIGYIYWLENNIQYQLSEYQQNLISVQH